MIGQAQERRVVADRLVAKVAEQARLKAQHFLFRGQNSRLKLLELGRDVALGIGQGLLARVRGGGLGAPGPC